MLGKNRGVLGFGDLGRRFGLIFGVALLVAAACSKADEKPPLTGEGAFGGNGGGAGPRGGGGGTSGSDGGGGEGGEPIIDPLAPVVHITSPDALGHPDDGAVLVASAVEVVCEVEQSGARGAEPVAPESVILQMRADDDTVLTENPGHETTPGVFTASFGLVTLPDGNPVPSGKISFHCSASDTADPPRTAEDQISTFVDHGPIITVTRPEPDSAYSPEGQVPFDFQVVPDPLAADDAGAEVDRVTLRVADTDIELDEAEPGQFHASVDLSDPNFPPVTTIVVQIDARNVRQPARGVSSMTYFIKVDSEGPTITVEEPENLAIVGGEVRVRFTVTDELSTVDKGTVSVTVNDDPPVPFSGNGSWTNTGNEFLYRFDSTETGKSIAQATINIDAKDEAGNASPGATLLLHLDNQPPIVDLDPPLIREFLEAGMNDYCSVAFDPVGPEAANDLDPEPVLAAHRYRALVWADTNRAPGQTVLFSSPTDQASVHIYLRDQPSRTRPLLIDTDADGVCDNIATTALLDEQMLPLDFKGGAWFGPSSGDPPGSPMMPPPTYCDYKGDPPPDDFLCNRDSDMRRVIKDDLFGGPPVVYAMGDMLNGNDPKCTGVDWEISFAEEGWVCVAALAKDDVGNIGVSRPLRLCYDDRSGDPPSCPMPAPSCTDGCTLRPTPVLGPWDPLWLFDPR